jgi:arylsulfatase A-like enzyme
VQGRSFLRLARGQDPNWKNRCYSQLRSGMVLDGSWKLIDNSLDGSGPFELYNLAEDPKEERDLSQDPRQRERIAEYRRLLAAWRAQRPGPIKVPGMSLPSYALISEEERRRAIQEAPDNRPRPSRRR